MDEPGVGARDKQERSPWGRPAAVVALFAVLGPPAAVLTFFLWFVLLTFVEVTPTTAAEWAEGFVRMSKLLILGTLFSLPTGYMMGLSAALGVGLAVSLWAWRSGAISYRVAIAAALALWLVPYLAWGDLHEAFGVKLSRLRGLLPAYLGAAVICTWAARRIFR